MRLFKAPRILRWLFPSRTWGFSVDDNSVFLTFDDGPQPQVTPWVLDLLKEQSVQATFFCVGNCARQHPDIMERIREEGHNIGNHTMNHEKGVQTPLNDYLRSVEEASAHISTKLFRPPYGRMTRRQESALIKRGYRIIMWTWLSYDFDPEMQDEVILDRIQNIRPGDILVFHDNIKTFDRLQRILPEIIFQLKSKGFRFSVVS